MAPRCRPTVAQSQLLDDAEPDVLAYMTFPAHHRTKLHSANPIERLNGAIKRRN
jgi:putative transposase